MKKKFLFLFLVLLFISTAMIVFPASYYQSWEDEPNNSPGQANTLGSTGTYPCGFQTFDTSTYGDDYFKFSAVAGQTVSVTGNANYPTDLGLILTDMSDTWLVGPIDSGGQGTNEYISGYTIPSDGDYCIVAYEALLMKGSGYTYTLSVTISEPPETDPPTYPGGNEGIYNVDRFIDDSANVYWYEATDASAFHYNIYVHSGVVNATTLFATTPYAQIDAPASSTHLTGIDSDLTYTFGVRAEDVFNNEELNTEIFISDPPANVKSIWEIY